MISAGVSLWLLVAGLYAFDNGTGRDQKLPFEEQAALLARTGYAGMGIFTGTARIPEMLAALDGRKLKLLSIYVDATDPGLPLAMSHLAGRDTMIMLTVRDASALSNIEPIVDMAAKHKLRVCLYPHIGFAIETTADAVRIVRKTRRSNLGVALNLYHTVAFHVQRCGSEDFDIARLIADALPHLWMVSINGMTRQTTDGSAALERLDRGDYDVAGFLAALENAGYTGPVALQSYSVKGDLEENLAASFGAWRSMLKRIGR
jgi:sugar phosphate isomerase/epimerase